MELASQFAVNLGTETLQITGSNIKTNMDFVQTEFYQKMLSNMENFVRNFVDDHSEPLLDTSFRLPQTSSPFKYEINLDIDEDKKNSKGFVGIDIDVTESTDVIVLNYRELQIDDVKFFDSRQERVEFYDFYTNSTSEFIKIELSRNLPKGTFRIEINYRGAVRPPSSGIYWDTYVIDGVTRYLVTTQFESDWSRQCFPGYDEPLYKAIFNLAITHRDDYTANANTEGSVIDK